MNTCVEFKPKMINGFLYSFPWMFCIFYNVIKNENFQMPLNNNKHHTKTIIQKQIKLLKIG